MEPISPTRSYLGRNLIQLSVLAALLIASAAVFLTKAQLAQDQLRPRALLDGLEFLFPIGIGWVIQHLYSQDQFERSLRRYAYSAYRRINDIRASVSRLDGEIARQRPLATPEQPPFLETFQLIASEMADTVRSSAADWAEIIGDEIQKLERLRELEDKKDASQYGHIPHAGDQTLPGAPDVEREIAQLRSDLPFFLQMAVERQGDILPRGGRFSRYAYDHFRQSILAEGAIYLQVSPSSDISTFSDAHEIDLRTPLRLWEEGAAGTSHMMMVDSRGKEIGEVENIFGEAGLYHRDFLETLVRFLPPATQAQMGGGGEFILNEATVTALDQDAHLLHIRVPMSQDAIPAPEQPPVKY